MKSCAPMSLFVFCVFLALIGLAVATHEASPVTQQQRAAALAYQQQRDSLDLAERSRQAQQWADLTAAWLPVAKVAGGLLIAVTPLALLALAAVGWVLTRRRAALVYPDSRGLLPADYDRLRRGEYDGHALAALAGHHAAQLEAARNPSPMLPPTLRTYAPRYNSPAPRVIGQPEQRPALAAPPSLAFQKPPTLGQLLQWGDIGPGKPLLLGYTRSEAGLLEPVTGGLDDVYSVGIGGMPGSGKSNTAAFMAGQAVAVGSKLLVIDPHRDAAQDSLARTLAPLGKAMVAPPAADEREILTALELIHAELAERKAGKPGEPWAIVIDEWTALVRRARVADLLIPLVEELGQESRKLQLRLLLCAQIWTVEAVGGSALRDALASSYVHRSKPSQARALIPQAGREVASLDRGQALLWRTSGEVVPVTVPRVLPQDLAAVAGLLPAPARDVSDPAPRRPSLAELINPPRPVLRVVRPDEDDGDGVPVRTSTPVEPEIEAETPQDAPAVPVRTSTPADVDPREARVIELFSQGVSRNSICTIVYGGKSPRTLREVNRILTEAGLLSDQAADGD